MLLNETLEKIQPLDEKAKEKAAAHLNQLTKPIGSLGKIEDIAIKLAGMSGNPFKKYMDKRVVIMAGDHGIVEEGVSAFPKEVTPQMVKNFINEGAAINVMAKTVGASVTCVDVGIASDVSDLDRVIHRKVAYGTKNMAKEPAMTKEEVIKAIEVGIEVAESLIKDGADVLSTGEMGIGNTATSSAVLSVFTNLKPIEVVGKGTGINDEQVIHKANVIEKAIQLHQPDRTNALDVMSKVGGLELAGICGLVLGAAANHTPIVVDGFISTVSALCAARLCERAKEYMIPSHASVEPGHKAALDALSLSPLLHMNMRLGEGTGTTLVFPIIDIASNIMNEMATFDKAGVSKTN